MITIAITETMEQVHKHLEKYFAIHIDKTDDRRLMFDAIAERWGDVNPADLLEQAELNSLALVRTKRLSNPKLNPWIDTNAQGDLFNSVPLKVPSMLVIDGKQMPYYKVSIVDGLAWWKARQSAKKSEGDAFQEAAKTRFDESHAAMKQSESLESLIRTAKDNGLDPRKVLYARAQA